MANAEIYLDSFLKIEKHLKALLGIEKFTPFSDLLYKASEQNKLIRNYKQTLQDFSDLRNAIVHSPKKDGNPIADPREDILHQIENIYQKISNPKLVGDQFKRKVFTITLRTPLAAVLKTMVSEDYSQAPIVDQDRIIGLLNKESITNWMGWNVINDSPDFLLSETLVKDVISENKPHDNYTIIPRKTNLVEARDYFIERIGSPVPLEALLITENGHASEGLIGIITRSEDLGIIIQNI